MLMFLKLEEEGVVDEWYGATDATWISGGTKQKCESAEQLNYWE